MKKWIIPVVTLIILVGGVAAGIFLVRQSTEFREKAAPATSLSFSAPSQSINTGDSVLVSVKINTGENQIAGVQLAIQYDPNVLQVESISKGNFLGENATTTSPIILPEENLIDYAIFLPFSSTPVQGEGTIALLSLTALQEGDTTISFLDARTYVLEGNQRTAQTQAYGVDEDANVVASTTPITLTIQSTTQPVATPTPTGDSTSPTSTPTPTTAVAAPTATPTPTPTDSLGVGGTNLPTSTPTPTTAVAAPTATPTNAQLAQNLTTPTNNPSTPTTSQLMDSGVEDYSWIYILLGIMSLIASGGFLVLSKADK